MLIVCPACSSSYRIVADALGSGRTMRCARCRAEWFAGGEAEAPAPVRGIDEADLIDVFDAAGDAAPGGAEQGSAAAADLSRRNESKASKRKAGSNTTPRFAGQVRLAGLRRMRLRPAVAFAAAGAAALACALTARADVVRRAPGLASLYAAVKLPVNVVGFTIENVTSVEEIEEGVPILLVAGTISNAADHPADAPRLRLSVRSGDDRELYAWTTVVAHGKLEPGASAAFRARLASPPAEGRAVSVRFLSRHDLLSSPR